ncbi:LacI family DNA-binding transcriptional regulator [Zhihengliuella halotolerans]|uniref:LacI family DNA-binding transcriptional regulator n=1 Tax=Zhihengliuella halotolerans TaxID=370736 RepID=UPI001C680CFA|nr:LacI family DNA-binding transcriptional regulator [Zhihengliuella halotolerans]
MTLESARPTIIDVARAAGVSKSLVSSALRGDPGVSAASRERVLAAAGRLGYRKNGWAQRLVSGRSNLIGVLLTDLRNAYHTDIVNGIEDAAAAAGYGVLLSHGRRDRDVLLTHAEELLDVGVDGVVAITSHLPPADLQRLADRAPVVVVGRPAAVPAGVGWVSNDDEAGARLAVDHLAARGHERIAFLTASDRPAAAARRGSYRQRIAELAARPREYDARTGDVEALLADVRTPDGPTAVFAANDRVAARLLGGAIDAGLTVPGDLAIVGYDNTELAGLLRPSLTSIDQPRTSMGRDAMAQLAALIGGGEPGREVAAPSLVARASTGA